jgi:hypothetical protein
MKFGILMGWVTDRTQKLLEHMAKESEDVQKTRLFANLISVDMSIFGGLERVRVWLNVSTLAHNRRVYEFCSRLVKRKIVQTEGSSVMG